MQVLTYLKNFKLIERNWYILLLFKKKIKKGWEKLEWEKNGWERGWWFKTNVHTWFVTLALHRVGFLKDSVIRFTTVKYCFNFLQIKMSPNE